MRKLIILCLCSFLLGSVIFFFVGRSASRVKEKTVYVKGDTVAGTISHTQLKPVKEENPTQPALPLRLGGDTTYLPSKTIYVAVEVDTAAIIAEYVLKRSYDILAFDDDKMGKLELFPSLQYNRLIEIDYKFTPVKQLQRISIDKTWTPFVSASYSTLNHVGVGGGVFYHNIGVEYQFLKGFGGMKNAHNFGMKIRF